MCINCSSIYRDIVTGCINQAGTYRLFLLRPALASSYEGGRLICRSTSPSFLRWVVSDRSAEVSRTWDCRNDANTRAQQVSGCTGWFVPTVSQLQNPGYCCRFSWPSASFDSHWSSTSFNASNAYLVSWSGGGISFPSLKAFERCVRSFRCVTY